MKESWKDEGECWIHNTQYPNVGVEGGDWWDDSTAQYAPFYPQLRFLGALIRVQEVNTHQNVPCDEAHIIPQSMR